MTRTFSHDVFISHASEDREEYVIHLVQILQRNSIRVWFDQLSLEWGDYRLDSISKGLANSRFGIVVLSRHYLQKPWPMQELEGLWQREVMGGKMILTILHNISEKEVTDRLPMIAGKVALNSAVNDLSEVATRVIRMVRGDSTTNQYPPRTEPSSPVVRLGEFVRLGESAGLAQFQRCAELAKYSQEDSVQVGLGVGLLYFRHFEEALSQFSRVLQKSPQLADANYYYALALLKGRRPKTLSLGDARRMLEHLERALRLDPNCAVFDSFTAIIKHDYFALNGLSVPPPGAAEHLRRAKNKPQDVFELEGLLMSVALRDPEFILALRQ